MGETCYRMVVDLCPRGCWREPCLHHQRSMVTTGAWSAPMMSVPPIQGTAQASGMPSSTRKGPGGSSKLCAAATGGMPLLSHVCQYVCVLHHFFLLFWGFLYFICIIFFILFGVRSFRVNWCVFSALCKPIFELIVRLNFCNLFFATLFPYEKLNQLPSIFTMEEWIYIQIKKLKGFGTSLFDLLLDSRNAVVHVPS